MGVISIRIWYQSLSFVRLICYSCDICQSVSGEICCDTIFFSAKIAIW